VCIIHQFIMNICMKVMKPSRIFFLLTYLMVLVRSDMSPNPNPYFVANRNGVTQGPIYLHGSATYAWEEDDEGFTVLQAGNRTYFYAKRNESDGDLVMTSLRLRQKVNGVLVGQSPQSLGIQRHEQPDKKVQHRKCGVFCEKTRGGHDRQLRNLVSTTGKMKNLIVLFKFSDHTTRTLPSAADITTLMNHAGDGVTVAYSSVAPTGSVRYVVYSFYRYLLRKHCDTLIFFIPCLLLQNIENIISRALMDNYKSTLLLQLG
jgi:hypothetical protein